MWIQEYMEVNSTFVEWFKMTIILESSFSRYMIYDGDVMKIQLKHIIHSSKSFLQILDLLVH